MIIFNRINAPLIVKLSRGAILTCGQRIIKKEYLLQTLSLYKPKGYEIEFALNQYMMDRIGIANTVLILGAVYFVVMMIGARILRRPPAGWKPAGWTPSTKVHAMITDKSVSRNQERRESIFYSSSVKRVGRMARARRTIFRPRANFSSMVSRPRASSSAARRDLFA